MKYINMYYGTKGGYVSGSERFDSAAEAAAKGAKSPNFALVLPYVPKAERGGQVQTSTQEQASMPFTITDYQDFVVEDGTHKVVTDDGEAVKILEVDGNHVVMKVTDMYSNEVSLDVMDASDDNNETEFFGYTLLIVRA